MKLLLLAFFGWLATVLVPQDHDVKELRSLLNEGNVNKKAAEKLYEKVGGYSGADPLLLGYKASAYALRAKYSSNPLKKLKSIKTSSRLFKDAVSKDGSNLELRFMRYAVEVNTPRSLGLSGHIEEDKGVLITALRNYPNSAFTPETATIARDFMILYCNCSEDEKQVLNNLKI